MTFHIQFGRSHKIISETPSRLRRKTLFLLLGQPSALICHKSRAFRKRSLKPMNLKTPAFLFRVNEEHFENRLFDDDGVRINMWFSSKTNPKWPTILRFEPGE